MNGPSCWNFKFSEEVYPTESATSSISSRDMTPSPSKSYSWKVHSSFSSWDPRSSKDRVRAKSWNKIFSNFEIQSRTKVSKYRGGKKSHGDRFRQNIQRTKYSAGSWYDKVDFCQNPNLTLTSTQRLGWPWKWLCKPHHPPPTQTFHALLDELESWNLAQTLTRPIWLR